MAKKLTERLRKIQALNLVNAASCTIALGIEINPDACKSNFGELYKKPTLYDSQGREIRS